MAYAKSPGLTLSGLQKLITPSSVTSLSKPGDGRTPRPPTRERGSLFFPSSYISPVNRPPSRCVL